MKFKGNKAQEEAIKTINGPVMIVSCPGSGKTTTLIRRIHEMIERGVAPTNILMVTFSRAAAMEMKEKYEKFFGTNPGISFQTIHSLCFNLLIKEGKCRKTDVLQENEKLDFLVSVIRSYPKTEGDLWEIAKSVATEITSVKNNYVNVNKHEPQNCDTEMFRDAYFKYERWKESINKIDFDDMLILCNDMLRDNTSIRKKWAGHFQYIQCDEYQDTNMIQRDVLYMLSSKNQNLCVVGDDDQSIYRFRGARPEIMLHFMDDFPNGKKIMMGTNYRSAEEVVEKAGKIIKKNTTRYGKDFVSQRGIDGDKGYTEYIRVANKTEEMDKLLEIIQQKHQQGVEYKDMAVLFRENRQAAIVVSMLSNAKIPFYAVDNVRCIYDGWIFSDIKTYVDLACGNYADDLDMRQKFLSVLNKPNRFLDARLFENADYSRSGFHSAIYPMVSSTYWKYQQALEHVDDWMRLFGPGKLDMEDLPTLAFDRLAGGRTIHYDKHMNDMAAFRKTDPDDYFEEYYELMNDASNYDTIREWFAHGEWLSRHIQEESRKKDVNGITLATMHRSKGLEWKVVFVIDCNDGVVPHRNSSDTITGLEEERRLFYVAMTRAKDELYVINSNRNESPFIKEANLLTARERELLKSTPKYLPGKKIKHKSFGIGTLVSYGPNIITVNFPQKGNKNFQFPKAFEDGYLEYQK